MRVARHADFDERAKGGGSSGPFDGGEKGKQPTWDGLLESQIVLLARERKLVETRFGQVPRGRRIGGEVQDKALAAAVAQTDQSKILSLADECHLDRLLHCRLPLPCRTSAPGMWNCYSSSVCTNLSHHHNGQSPT